jgi:hypothetical protein
VTLSQIVHLTLRCRFEPDANFDKQRRLIAYAPMLQPASLSSDNPHGSVFSPTAAFLSARMIVAKCVA